MSKIVFVTDRALAASYMSDKRPYVDESPGARCRDCWDDFWGSNAGHRPRIGLACSNLAILPMRSDREILAYMNLFGLRRGLTLVPVI